jgi:DNA invertase Pin-like site-specific DNA recombinase
MKRVAGLVRVSTTLQTHDSQESAIKEFVSKRGDYLVLIYSETVSGIKQKSERPVLTQMLADAKDGKFDKLVVWDISRLGRNIASVSNTIEELCSYGVDVEAVANNLSTDVPGGKMLIHLFSAIASWERDLIKMRTKEGIAAARAKNKRWGRPTNCNPQTKATAIELRSKGMSIRKICSLLKIGVAKYYELTEGAFQDGKQYA